MISHEELTEIRIIENDAARQNNNPSPVELALIQAYHNAVQKHKIRHQCLLDCDADIQFAYTCCKDPKVHHFLEDTTRPCKECQDGWIIWKNALSQIAK